MKINRTAVTISAITLVVIVSVGLVVVQAMLTSWNNMPPFEFKLVNKEYVTGDFWHSVEYRMYYNTTGYYLTSAADFQKFQIGDWFNGTVILSSY